MTSFNYYYRKRSLMPQVLFGFVFIAIILFWMRGAWVMMGGTFQTSNQAPEIFSQIRTMFTIVPLVMLAVGLYITLSSLVKILSPSAVISGDDQGLTIRGSWLKTYRFSWSELSYVRYEQRSHSYYSQNSMSSRSYLQELLLIKPQVGRTVSVGIHQLDGAIDDIVADIRQVAPNLEIKGFEK